jgi:hypothetical protein
VVLKDDGIELRKLTRCANFNELKGQIKPRFDIGKDKNLTPVDFLRTLFPFGVLDIVTTALAWL